MSRDILSKIPLIRALVSALLFVFIFFLIGVHLFNNSVDKALNDERNDFVFVSKEINSKKTMHSGSNLYHYDWISNKVILISEDIAGEDSVAGPVAFNEQMDLLFSLGKDGLYGFSEDNKAQFILSWEDIQDMARSYEKDHRTTYLIDHSIEKREKIWGLWQDVHIYGYQDGCLLDSRGGVYYCNLSEGLEVSSFENLPLVSTYFLAGKDKDMILAVVRDEDDLLSGQMHRKKAEVYLYDIKAQKSEKIFEAIASNQEFCLNADGTRLAYLDSSEGEYPALKIYDIEKREIVKTTGPIKKLSDKQFRGTGLQEVEFLTLLDSGEVLARRRDVTIGTSLASGSENTLVLISENGQTKAPKALQKYRITDVVTEYDAAWQQD